MADECWWDELANIEICMHILGPDFDPMHHSTDGQGSCFVGFFDSDEELANANCIGCDVGCRPCIDDPYTHMIWWYDRLVGSPSAYLRPDWRGNNSTRYRDAYNRISDVHSYDRYYNPDDPDNAQQPFDRSKHFKFLQSISLERAQCYENWGIFAHWDEDNHSCNCMPWASISCPSGPDADQIPILGYRPDRWFVNQRNWPPDKNDNPPDLQCTSYLDDPIHATVFVEEKRGNTIFLSNGHNPPCTSNALTLCAGYVPAESDCDEGTGVFSCAVIREDGNPPARYVEPDSDDAFFMDRLDLMEWNPSIRLYDWMSDRQKTDIRLRNQVLATVGNHQFGDTNFEQLDHMVAGTGDNNRLGDFDRSKHLELDDPDAPVIKTLTGIERRTGKQLEAELVIIGVDIESNWFLHKAKRWHSWDPAANVHSYYVGAYVAYELQVELGIRITNNPQEIDYRYEAIAGSFPLVDGGFKWHGWYDVYEDVIARPRDPGRDNDELSDRAPVVTEEIVGEEFGLLRPPRFVEWHGRRNTHSEPAVTYALFHNNQAPPSVNHCRQAAVRLGVMEVGPLPGQVDDTNDPNTFYAGSVKYRFPQPPPESDDS